MYMLLLSTEICWFHFTVRFYLWVVPLFVSVCVVCVLELHILWSGIADSVRTQFTNYKFHQPHYNTNHLANLQTCKLSLSLSLSSGTSPHYPHRKDRETEIASSHFSDFLMEKRFQSYNFLLSLCMSIIFVHSFFYYYLLFFYFLCVCVCVYSHLLIYIFSMFLSFPPWWMDLYFS